MSQTAVDTVDKDLGNTKTRSLSKQQHRNWCFTIHLDKEEVGVDEVDKLSSTLAENAKKFVFQVEKTPTTGRLHYQGYAEFKNARQMGGVQKVLAPHGKAAHLTVADGSDISNYKYCTKIDSRWMVGGEAGWPPKLVDPLEGLELYEWQNDVLKLVGEKPDNRKIYWFYDTEGNNGKTAMAKHLCMKYMNEILYVNGRAADIQCGVAAHINAGKTLRAAVFGYPRSVENFVSYGALEAIKDGIFYNGKYESGMVMYNVPHVIVMANFPPDQTKLSSDRWVIRDIGRAIAESF
jgi:hypothetical protein